MTENKTLKLYFLDAFGGFFCGGEVTQEIADDWMKKRDEFFTEESLRQGRNAEAVNFDCHEMTSVEFDAVKNVFIYKEYGFNLIENVFPPSVFPIEVAESGSFEEFLEKNLDEDESAMKRELERIRWDHFWR